MTKRTTASELIKKLQALPPDTNLVIAGGEGGHDDVDINPDYVVHLKENQNCDTWYYGDHETVHDCADADFTAIPLVSKYQFND